MKFWLTQKYPWEYALWKLTTWVLYYFSKAILNSCLVSPDQQHKEGCALASFLSDEEFIKNYKYILPIPHSYLQILEIIPV